MTKQITYGPTHTRMLNILGDGEPHTRKELLEVCGIKHRRTDPSTVSVHISLLRDKLQKEESNGYTLDILPMHRADRSSYRLVKIAKATINDIKSLTTVKVNG